ncbi:MAG: hypothetical protein DCC58_14045 [Chloroflexi bacterium]|nr:MAG: hypothetical protein DCC58_14045 [Chloroflexota bacterium]
MDDTLLNADQRRRLTSVLSHVEDVLVITERLLCIDEQRRLRPVVLQLEPDAEQTLETELEALRAALATTQDRFNLSPNPQDGRRLLRSQFTLLWTGLEDARAATLRRYGAVHPDLAASLDPLIDELLIHIERVLTLLKPSGPSAESE